MSIRNILILGASYGSLLASKLMLAGHNVSMVCLPAEANLINAEGFRVRMPLKGREMVEIDSRKLPGKVSAGAASVFDPKDFDLIGLAMQGVQLVARQKGRGHPAINAIVALVDWRLETNHQQAA
jgi:ketopantoate reductase